MLNTRIAKLTMNHEGLIFQEDENYPVITVIHFDSQKRIKLRFPKSFNESNLYQKNCEKELVANLIQVVDNDDKLDIQQIMKEKLERSEPTNGHMVIHDYDLIFVRNHSLVSLPLRDYIVGKFKEDDVIDVPENILTTIFTNHDSHIIRINYW